MLKGPLKPEVHQNVLRSISEINGILRTHPIFGEYSGPILRAASAMPWFREVNMAKVGVQAAKEAIKRV